MSKAIVLFSGGLDSTTCLEIARSEGFEPCALVFSYHQRHSIEVEAAEKIISKLGINHYLTLQVPLQEIGGSALTRDMEVPEYSGAEHGSEIPVTYVPARNTIFLSYALGWAEVLGASDIFIGVNVVDYSGYPDCRPEYIQAFENMANLATKKSVTEELTYKIHTPLIYMSKGEIIQKGIELGVDYSWTHSCYDPDENGLACGKCDSCVLRKKGFSEAGMEDPTLYRG